MADGTATISLKGGSPVWSGMGDASTTLPATAAFRVMRNCILSRDGTEIISAPGSRVGGRPFFGRPFEINALTPGATQTAVQVKMDGYAGAEPHWGTAGACYVAGNLAIDDGVYAFQRSGPLTILVNVGSQISDTSGRVWISILRAVHALAVADGRPVCVFETALWFDEGTELRTNVACLVGDRPLDFDDPVMPGFASTTDEGFVLWPSPTMDDVHAADDNLIEGFGWSYDVVSRMVADTLNGRVVIAVPGVGCMFQAHVRGAPPYVPIRPPQFVLASDHRWTRLYGIPRGVLPNPASLAQSNGSGSTFNNGQAATFQYAIGYYDPITLEIGLMSTVAEFTTEATADSVTLRYVPARHVLWEAIGLGVVLYMSQDGGNELFPIATIKPVGTANEVPTQVSGATYYGEFTLNNPPTPAISIFPRRTPSVEQHMQGASWCNVARGRVFSGGARPDYWSVAGWGQKVATPGADGYFDWQFWCVSEETVGGLALLDESPCAYGRVPDSYGGNRYMEPLVEMHTGRLANALGITRLQTRSGGSPAFLGRCIVAVDADLEDSQLTEPDLSRLLVYNRPELVQFSEEELDQASPAVNRLPQDLLALSGKRTTGGKRFGDAELVFTQNETLVYTWSTTPRHASRQVLSNLFGCIAPSAIAEGPFGVAWLSAEGPCLFNGEVQWIGSNIAGFWSELKRDSEGMMAFAQVAVDLERRVVVWAVIRDAGGLYFSGTDEEIAKLPCDTLLVWHWELGQFMTIDRSGTDHVFGAMAVMPYADGKNRVTLCVAGDEMSSLVGWEDDAADMAETAYTATVTQARNPASAQVFASGISSALGTGDMAFIRSPAGELRWFGAVTGAGAGDSVHVSNADGAVWRAGDVFVGKVQHIELETQGIQLGGRYPSTVRGIEIHTDLEGDHHWVRVRVEDDKGTIHPCGHRWGERIPNDGVVRVNAGTIRGSRFRLLLDFVGDGRIRIKDIHVTVVPGG